MNRSRGALSFALLLLAACGSTPPAHDAAVEHDATAPHDAAHADTGAVDAGSPGEGCAETFSGCTTIDDHTGAAEVTVAFEGFAYAPRCIRVSPGTVVTIPASSLHPLRGATCSSPESPLPTTPSNTTGEYTFTAPGSYGYFCNAHGTNAGTGMAGLVIVE